MKYRSIQRIASYQHQTVSRSQILQSVTRSKLQTATRHGVLTRVRPRTYRLLGAPDDWLNRLHAVLLQCDRAVVSARSAARLWGILPFKTARLEFVIPAGARRPSATTSHRSNCLSEEFVTQIEGMRVTTPERTIIDLSAVCDISVVRRAIDAALDAQLITVTSLANTLDLMAARGRRRIRMIRRLLSEFALDDPKNASRLERKAVRVLQRHGLPRPEAQVQVRVNGRSYFIDLAYSELKLAIEIDSVRFHDNHRKFHDDRRRDIDLQETGWTVYHFTSRSIEDLPKRILPYFRSRAA